MSGFFVGITVGMFMGIGITILCLIQKQENAPVCVDVWIDEALDKAIRTLARKY